MAHYRVTRQGQGSWFERPFYDFTSFEPAMACLAIKGEGWMLGLMEGWSHERRHGPDFEIPVAWWYRRDGSLYQSGGTNEHP